MTASSIRSTRSRGRGIVHLTAGHTHGPITRLMSPGDLGELVKPFVFLDYFEAPSSGGPQMADHPHSGIATHTTLLQGSVGYRDSTGKSGTLRAGSVEWMQAGGGVWHGGDLRPGEPVRGYQLWVALPAALELKPAFSQYLDPEAIESDGRARVLLGSHGRQHLRDGPGPQRSGHTRRCPQADQHRSADHLSHRFKQSDKATRAYHRRRG